MKREIAAKCTSLGEALSRPECDEFMRDLALMLPASGVSVEDAHHKLDLYWVFLRGAGMTAKLLAVSGEKYVMAPRKGKPKFFPDPGQLVEIVQDEILDRKQKLAGLQRGLDVINGVATPEEIGRRGRPAPIGMDLAAVYPDRRNDLAQLAARMREQHPEAPRQRGLSTARPEDQESRSELINTLHRTGKSA